MGIGEPFGCEIMPVGPTQVESFTEHVKRMVRDSPQAELKQRIRQAIRDGGATEDFIRRATAYLKARGITEP